MTTSHHWVPGMLTADEYLTTTFSVASLQEYTRQQDKLRADAEAKRRFERAAWHVLLIACVAGLGLALCLDRYTDWPAYFSGGLGLLLTLLVLAFGVVTLDEPGSPLSDGGDGDG